MFRLSILGIVTAASLSFSAGAELAQLPGIKGEDDRQLVETDAYPWSAIGRVNRRTGGFCTGTVIAEYRVLTAAHCLWNPRTLTWLPAQSLHFVAAYRRGEYLVHSGVEGIEVSHAKAQKQRNPKIDPENDWALLRLTEPVGKVTGALATAKVSLQVNTTSLIQAGYSQDKAHILSVHSGCKILGFSADNRLVLHDCDATKGDSGSPIFVRRGGRYSLVGMHVATMTQEGRVIGIAISRRDGW
ncbi:MAG: trypsin-like serine protease [Rhodospirillales bacterium]|jgi:protease YdgD|nr:trypsin-like serine protease [Rhodospirillales bacterium]